MDGVRDVRIAVRATAAIAGQCSEMARVGVQNAAGSIDLWAPDDDLHEVLLLLGRALQRASPHSARLQDGGHSPGSKSSKSRSNYLKNDSPELRRQPKGRRRIRDWPRASENRRLRRGFFP